MTAAISDPIIEVDNVTMRIGRTVIHRDLSLNVRAGEVLAIIGGSGSGKTTLLRLMLGLERPSAGEVRIFGQVLGGCAQDEFERVRLRWGVLFQQGALFSSLTVFENVALPLRELGGLDREMVSRLVMQKLVQVGLNPADALKLPSELSGGMVKRVSLARALILDPLLLFLDEPTAGLDPASSKQFVRLIQSLRAEMKLTVVMITHDVDTLFALADRVAVLADRQLVALGALAEVARMPHPFIHEFFLGHTDRCAEENLLHFRSELSMSSLLEQEI